jgi:hypothetical protein
MSVKIFVFVCLSAALAMTQLAAAGEPPAPGALGQLEGILDTCSNASPKSAADDKKQREKLTSGVAEKDLVKIRKSQEYKQAYDSIRERVDQASSDEVNEACHLILGGK